MKHITLSALLLLAGVSTQAQVFESDLEVWADGLPEGMGGVKTSIALDSVFQETENVHGGTSALRLQLSTGSHKRFTTLAISVTAGASYDITFWVRGSGKVRTNIFDGRAADSGYGTYNAYVELTDGTTWQEVTQTVLCANTSAEGEFIFSVFETDAPSHIVIDDITISEGVVVPPVDATIFEIQNTTDVSGASPLVNQAVITSGIVTGVATGAGYFIQDGQGAWNGIYVNDAVNAPVLGDLVSVTGTVQESFFFTRLSSVLAYSVTSTGNTLPAAEILSGPDASQEQWESVLVTVPDVECVVLPTAENFQQWTVSNWQGSIFVDDLLYAATPTLGQFYTITGLVFFSFEEWKLLPRDLNDLSIGSGVGELAGATVTLFPNPASTTMSIDLGGLRGRTEYSLHDATGRVVLADVATQGRSTIDVSTLTNGIYVITLRNGSASWSTRVAVQH